jgi:hypothetical protein
MSEMKHGAIEDAVKALSAETSKELKNLLENKHLYQKVTVDVDLIVQIARKGLPSPIGRESDDYEYLQSVRSFEYQTYALSNIDVCPVAEESVTGLMNEYENGTVLVPTQNVKIYCPACTSNEIFKPVQILDVTSDKHGILRVKTPPAKHFQLFCLTYQCQRCHTTPQGFLIRRENWSFYLDGRSPFEHIERPKYLPDAEWHFFRDAMIGLRGGKTLAALFYLRTFIEQFARRQTGIKDRKTGDEIMRAYKEALLPAHRDHMPSLSTLYDQLSAALHTAEDSTQLFEKVMEEVEQHFQIRKVYKMAEKNWKDFD